MKYLLLLSFVIFQFYTVAQPPLKLALDPSSQLVIEKTSKLVLPPGYDAAKTYPLVVFLPFTGGSGTDLMTNYAYQTGELRGNFNNGGSMEIDFSPLMDSLQRMPTDAEANAYIEKVMQEKMNVSNHQTADTKEKSEEYLCLEALHKSFFGQESDSRSFIALLPDESGSTTDHDWKGFSACISRYENRIIEDIETYSKEYSIDQNKIILVGYSLGGDLGWAISQRYPEKFKGAVISGTRCGYTEKGAMTRLAKNDARFYIAMGDNESDVRMKGAKLASTKLTNVKIKNLFRTIPDAGHDPVNLDQLKEAINFILFE